MTKTIICTSIQFKKDCAKKDLRIKFQSVQIKLALNTLRHRKTFWRSTVARTADWTITKPNKDPIFYAPLVIFQYPSPNRKTDFILSLWISSTTPVFLQRLLRQWIGSALCYLGRLVSNDQRKTSETDGETKGKRVGAQQGVNQDLGEKMDLDFPFPELF